MQVVEHETFAQHCRESVLGLRGALLELYRAAGADPSRPQDVARRFGLNKNLTWKLARIIQTQNAFEAVPLIPGPSGMEIVLEKLGDGADAGPVQRTREALQAFHHMIEVHVGDRAALELMLDSMGTAAGRLEMSRKLAFRGASGLWGLQARARVTAQFIAPNPEDPELVDAAQIAGLEKVRRFREIERWPVFRLGRHARRPELSPFGEREALEDGPPDKPGLIPSFCTGAVPEIHAVERDDGLHYEIGKGPVGRTGEFTCYFGYVMRRFVPRYATKPGGQASMHASISMPVETAVFDLFIHTELAGSMRPRPAVHGGLSGVLGSLDPITKLPVPAEVVDLGLGADVSTPLSAGYESLVDLAFQKAGWRPSDFRCFRLVVEYPPMPSTIVMEIELPTRPEA